MWAPPSYLPPTVLATAGLVDGRWDGDRGNRRRRRSSRWILLSLLLLNTRDSRRIGWQVVKNFPVGSIETHVSYMKRAKRAQWQKYRFIPRFTLICLSCSHVMKTTHKLPVWGASWENFSALLRVSHTVYGLLWIFTFCDGWDLEHINKPVNGAEMHQSKLKHLSALRFSGRAQDLWRARRQ